MNKTLLLSPRQKKKTKEKNPLHKLIKIDKFIIYAHIDMALLVDIS